MNQGVGSGIVVPEPTPFKPCDAIKNCRDDCGIIK